MDAKTVNTEALREHMLEDVRGGLVAISGAANTYIIESKPIWSGHGGRETEAFQVSEEGKIFLCLESTGRLNDLSLAQTDWAGCVWQHRKIGRIIPSMLLLAWLSPPDVVFQSPTAFIRGFLEECSLGIGSVDETSDSASLLNADQNFETRPWRGIFCISHTEKVIFSQEVELKIAELPHWKPHVTIDLHRLERVNE
jgi:hypothetical protein